MCDDVEGDSSLSSAASATLTRFVRRSWGGDGAKKDPSSKSDPTASHRISIPFCCSVISVFANGLWSRRCGPVKHKTVVLLRDGRAEEVEAGCRQFGKLTGSGRGGVCP